MNDNPYQAEGISAPPERRKPLYLFGTALLSLGVFGQLAWVCLHWMSIPLQKYQYVEIVARRWLPLSAVACIALGMLLRRRFQPLEAKLNAPARAATYCICCAAALFTASYLVVDPLRTDGPPAVPYAYPIGGALFAAGVVFVVYARRIASRKSVRH
jgi:hypothetical protein